MWTRRRVLGGIGAASALGCAGLATPADPGEPGTLFLPTSAPSLPRVAWNPGPKWFAEAGGLYCPAPRTAGAALLPFAGDARDALSNRIRHFRELPALLDEARTLGTDLLYLVDYYEGRPDLTPDNYCWNKGDYAIRADLGGEEAFRDGVAAVQAAGGRVLLYLEPFVLEKGSAIAQAHGKEWSIRTADGFPDDPYPDAWKVCPANPVFQDYLVSVARRLMATGADGLHLDSFGFQRGWACVETAHGHAPADPEVFEAGCKRLVERLHGEVVAAMPDGVLMCEGPRVAGLFRWVSASQEWGVGALADRWVWAAAGQVPVFTANWSLDDLHQIVAMGHRLALGGRYWSTAPVGTLTDWYAANVPAQVPDKADERFRRFYAEDAFRELHRYRNAGLLAGRAVPSVDLAAPRRWDRAESFRDRAGLQAILDQGRALAGPVDRALAGAALPAAADHVRALVRARAAAAPALAGAMPTVLPSGSRDVVTYRFDGPHGTVLTAANVGGAAYEVKPPPGFAGTELVAGEAGFSVPGHTVRIWV